LPRRTEKLALLLALAVCPFARTQTPLPDLQQQAATLGSDLFAHSSSTGMVLVLVRNHEVAFHGFGETAPGSAVTPTQDSLLRLCSLSKIFATDLLIQLEHTGTLHLDDPLQNFAPPHVLVPARAAAPKQPARSITLLDLATHTSGLPREVGTAPRGTPHLTWPGYAYRWRWLPKQRLRSAPGTVALYSNIGFDFLGDSIEKAARTPYATLFAQRIATPLGLRETGFTPNPAQCARLLLSAHDEGPCTDTQSSAASAGVYSTAADMTRFLQYLLGTGLPAVPAQTPDAQAVYIKPSALLHQQGLDHAGSVSGIGLGWMHTPGDAAHTLDIVEKTGGGAGFTTYIALDPAHQTGLFVAFTAGTSNNHVNVFKASNDLLLTLNGLPPLPAEAPKPARPRAKRSRVIAKKSRLAHS
jgi:D-alanyl-D-alanine-carboxypeptidase/D-alanyl-D-alanine-endopeptidase